MPREHPERLHPRSGRSSGMMDAMRLAPALAALALLAGCSPTTTPAAAPAAAVTCEAVPADLEGALFGEEYGFEVIDSAAVRSTEHENSIEGGTASVRAVDGIAKEFSSWPAGGDMSVTDAGAKAAKACLS